MPLRHEFAQRSAWPTTSTVAPLHLTDSSQAGPACCAYSNAVDMQLIFDAVLAFERRTASLCGALEASKADWERIIQPSKATITLALPVSCRGDSNTSATVTSMPRGLPTKLDPFCTMLCGRPDLWNELSSRALSATLSWRLGRRDLSSFQRPKTAPSTGNTGIL